MDPDALSAFLKTEARYALREIVRLAGYGVPPITAIRQISNQYSESVIEGFRQALAEELSAAIGRKEIKSYPIGKVTLSASLYAEADAVSAVAKSIIQRHADGLHDARKLALKLFEGYGFRQDEPLKLSPRDPKLPKYLKELLRDEGVRDELETGLRRLQASRLKTGALRAGYLQLIDDITLGAAADKLEKSLRVAYYERLRYFSNRIARTELAIARAAKHGERYLEIERLEVVEYRMSAAHPETDICDLYAGKNAFGLGPGLYPKREAPRPPVHPHCFCRLVPRYDKRANGKEEDDLAERRFLSRLPARDAARVVGSRAKLEEALKGTPVTLIANLGRPRAYRIRTLGSWATTAEIFKPKPPPPVPKPKKDKPNPGGWGLPVPRSHTEAIARGKLREKELFGRSAKKIDGYAAAQARKQAALDKMGAPGSDKLRALDELHKAAAEVKAIEGEMLEAFRKAFTKIKRYSREKAAALRAQGLTIDTPAAAAKALKITGYTAAEKAALRGSAKRFYEMFGTFADDVKEIINDKPRAYCSWGGETVNMGRAGLTDYQLERDPTLFHEFAHSLEWRNGESKTAMDWVKARASGEKKKLSEITGNPNYKDEEVAYIGKFISPYVGKDYGGAATEVVSMGVERFYSELSALRFWQEDREHFQLILGLLPL